MSGLKTNYSCHFYSPDLPLKTFLSHSFSSQRKIGKDPDNVHDDTDPLVLVILSDFKHACIAEQEVPPKSWCMVSARWQWGEQG